MPRRVYDPSVVRTILKRLAAGETLRGICSAEGMPKESTVRAWVIDKPKFAEQYERARNIGLDSMAEQLLAVAGDHQADMLEEDSKNRLARVQRDRLHVDTLKWYLCKLAPKKYGEKLEHGFDENKPLVITVRRLDKPHAETSVVGRETS